MEFPITQALSPRQSLALPATLHAPLQVPDPPEAGRRQGLAERAAAVAALADQHPLALRVQGRPPAAQLAERQAAGLGPGGQGEAAQAPFVGLAQVDEFRGRPARQALGQLGQADPAVGAWCLSVAHRRIILPLVIADEEAHLSKNPSEGVKEDRGAEEEALVLAARRDRAAFGQLYDRYFDAIYHYIARRVLDDAVAEDLAAEVWERALRAIDRFELRGLPFAAWLYRIAGNLIINHHRRARLWRWVPLGNPAASSPAYSQTELRTVLDEAMAQLSPADQEAIALYYYAGQSPEEMSLIFGCSVVAVHKRLHRARERLKSKLGGDPRAGSKSA